MVNIGIIFCISFLFFIAIKAFVITLFKALIKTVDASVEYNTFELLASCGILFAYLAIWITSMYWLGSKRGMTDVETYISYCLIGVICVIWCYFSWDILRIWTKPRLATSKERRFKKIVLYSLIFCFVIAQGYHQSLHVMDGSYAVPILFSVTNYSVIVALIAFDRLMNQIFSNKDK